MNLFGRLAALFRRRRREAEMSAELQAHLDALAERHIAAGLSPEDARYAALREFGGVEQIKERCRDERRWIWLEHFRQDVRHGVRSLRKDRRFTIVAVLTLALGIGANASIFSLLDAVLLRPLPFPEPDRLVAVWERNPETGGHNLVSSGNYLDWVDQNSAFEALGAFGPIGATLRDHGAPQIAGGTRLTPGMLALLRVQPMLGRGFIEGDNAEAGGREILISHGLWQTRFGGRPDIIGLGIHLDDTPMTIIGVMPPSFEFPARNNDFWLALRFDASDREARKSHQWRVLARLRPDVNVPATTAAMDVVTRRITAAHPEYMTGWGIDVVLYHADLVGAVRPTLAMLAGMVLLVLLVASSNVANLTLARAAGRQREVAIRGALGAGRGRVCRQLLTEAALLALLGTTAGLLLASWALPFLSALAPSQLPGFVPPRLNGAAVLAATAASVCATLIVGLAPAWWITRIDLRSLLCAGTTAAGSRALQRTRSILLVMQLSVATVLLVGTGLLLRSLANLHRVDFGFDPKNLLSATVNLPRTRYDTVARQAAFYERLRGELEDIPEIEGIAGTSDAPLANSSTFSFVIAGRPRPGPNPREDPVEVRAITPSYLSTLKLPLLSGRALTPADHADAAGVLLVNRAFAKLYFPDASAVGQRLSFVGPGGPWLEIVGTVGDVRDTGADRPAEPAIYVPYAQKPEVNLSALTVLVRTAVDPDVIRERVQRAFESLDPELPIRRLATVAGLYSGRLAQREFVAQLIATFAALALTLGIIGVYGVVSYSVAQRRREFGICVALGAAGGDIMRRVIVDGIRLVAIGVLVGAVGAIGLSRFVRNLLFEVRPLDPMTFAAVLAVLCGASLLALWLPARDAAKADPLTALRAE